MVNQQLLQISSEPSDLNMHKKILFDVIVKYYNQMRDPLLTNQDLDIHTGIIELIGKSKLTTNKQCTGEYYFLN